MFDFKNVLAVGQGFTDQLFRVYQNEHPKLEMHICNANEDVAFMIGRSKN